MQACGGAVGPKAASPRDHKDHSRQEQGGRATWEHG